MAKMYSCRPSALIGLEDPYTSFCFDEACAYIHMEIVENNKKPMFNHLKEDKPQHYTRASEFYRRLEER